MQRVAVVDVRVYKDLFYTDKCDTAQMLDIFLPERESFPVFVFFHGGGLESGSRSLEFMSRFCEDMTENNIGVVSVEYRMYPDAKYPDFIDDGAQAVAWVKENIGQYGDCRGIFVGGTSAGGYISQMLCFDGSHLARHGIDVDDITAFIHDAGQPTVHFNVLRERGIDYRRVIIDEAAPLYHVGTAEQYPPMLIIVSDNDMENRPEQTALLVGTLRHFGYDMSKVELLVTQGTHTWYIDKLNADGHNEYAAMLMPFILKYS